MKAGRTTTHNRQVLDKGAEPDQCYWLGDDARRMAGKRQLDLTIDPPPALAIEVDITHSSLDRLPIFAALGIPEVWRLTVDSLQFLHLHPRARISPGIEAGPSRDCRSTRPPGSSIKGEPPRTRRGSGRSGRMSAEP